MNDIISAISTANGVGGVAIIRISGQGCISLAEKMFFPLKKVKEYVSNVMYVGEIDGGDFKDFGMMVVFRSPHSFTGEDTVEFHCHGGIAITRGILNKTFSLGARGATNGEFTKRAFLNGKLSLSSCEGLIDMINSEYVSQVKAGYSLYRERLCKKVAEMQNALKDCLAEMDANIDYPEEGLEQTATDKLKSACESIKKRLEQTLSSYNSGSRIKNGVKVALAGKPNTGKSSILNSLLDCDKAIVTSVAGTTRDVVEGDLDINGVKFVLYDTAGIRESEDEVEKIGIERSTKVMDESDVCLFVMDGSEPLSEEDEKILAKIEVPVIRVCNKSDKKVVIPKEKYDLEYSALTGDTKELKDKIYALGMGNSDNSADLLIEQRHYEALTKALNSIKKVLDNIEEVPLELIEYDVRDAWSILGEITGETASESIVDEIFSKFCVGK